VVEQDTAIVGAASYSYIRRRKTNPNLAKTQLEYIRHGEDPHWSPPNTSSYRLGVNIINMDMVIYILDNLFKHNFKNNMNWLW